MLGIVPVDIGVMMSEVQSDFRSALLI